MTDQNRKTLRSFYCRDYLWEHFEQMAQELGCSMDYLINESMRLYARSRDQGPDPAPPGGAGGPGGANMGMGQSVGPDNVDRFDVGGYSGQNNADSNMNHRTFQQVPAVGAGSGPNRQQGQAMGGGMPQQRSGPGATGGPGGPPPPPRPGAGGPGAGGPPGRGGPGGNWQQGGSAGRPQNPSGGYGADAGRGMGAGRPPIYLSFSNNRYVIDQEKYVIGRGSKQTDLTIRDGNISRKHCVVIFRNGSYYIKDLDSTNGIEYRGNRIESKKIEEGDVFYLCDYELRFSYHG